MGFFSWKTQDTNRSISNYHSGKKTFKVFMTDNKNNAWIENNYAGYGEFAGKDYYELLAEMNGLESSRDAGITLSFSGKPHITPNLNEKLTDWKNEEPKICKKQGYFYE